MGMWDRLGNVLKSYINDDDTLRRGSSNHKDWRNRSSSNDPDLNAAFDELNDYLNKDKAAGNNQQNRTNNFSDDYSSTDWEKKWEKMKPPEELRPDFEELGVAFGASADECKEAYKKLLKIHHPDKHANHEGNFQKATNKSARLNAAYDRIEQWRKMSK